MRNFSPSTLVKDCIATVAPNSRYQKRLYYRLAKLLNLFLRKKATVADMAKVNRAEFAEFLEINYTAATIVNYFQSFDALARKLGAMPPHKPKGRSSRELSDKPGTLWHICQREFFRVNHAIRSPLTKGHYRSALCDFKEAIGHEPRVEDLTDDNIGAMMNRLLDLGDGPVYVNQRRARIVSLWTWLAKKRRTEAFPTIRKLKEPKRAPQAWTLPQLDKLMAACRRQRGEIVRGISRADFWTGLHFTFWNSAERLSATLALEWSMLDMESGLLTVPYTIRKGQSSDETYKLTSETLAILARMKAAGHRRIFPWPLSLSSFFNHYKKLLTQAGLPTDRKSKTHRMRRSVASHLAARGFDATAALGHSGPEVTKCYLDPSIVGSVRASDVLPVIGA
jgi:integrase